MIMWSFTENWTWLSAGIGDRKTLHKHIPSTNLNPFIRLYKHFR